MCEFKVYLSGDDPAEKELVAQEIVVAQIKDGQVVLLPMMGEAVIIPSAVIREVNTMTQELILQKIVGS
jgi:predicted RNA-binding protein